MRFNLPSYGAALLNLKQAIQLKNNTLQKSKGFPSQETFLPLSNKYNEEEAWNVSIFRTDEEIHEEIQLGVNLLAEGTDMLIHRFLRIECQLTEKIPGYDKSVLNANATELTKLLTDVSANQNRSTITPMDSNVTVAVVNQGYAGAHWQDNLNIAVQAFKDNFKL